MIRAIDLSKIRELVSIEGLALADALSRKVPVASGALKESPKATTKADGSVVTMTLEASPTLKFVEGGRRSGKKFPPLDAIKSWCIVKGIPVKAAFPIAKKIAEKGIEPKPVLAPIIAERADKFRESLTKAFGEQVESIGKDLVAEWIENKKAA